MKLSLAEPYNKTNLSLGLIEYELNSQHTFCKKPSSGLNTESFLVFL